jgi:hypothetical protein
MSVERVSNQFWAGNEDEKVEDPSEGRLAILAPWENLDEERKTKLLVLEEERCARAVSGRRK